MTKQQRYRYEIGIRMRNAVSTMRRLSSAGYCRGDAIGGELNLKLFTQKAKKDGKK